MERMHPFEGGAVLVSLIEAQSCEGVWARLAIAVGSTSAEPDAIRGKLLSLEKRILLCVDDADVFRESYAKEVRLWFESVLVSCKGLLTVLMSGYRCSNLSGEAAYDIKALNRDTAFDLLSWACHGTRAPPPSHALYDYFGGIPAAVVLAAPMVDHLGPDSIVSAVNVKSNISLLEQLRESWVQKHGRCVCLFFVKHCA